MKRLKTNSLNDSDDGLILKTLKRRPPGKLESPKVKKKTDTRRIAHRNNIKADSSKNENIFNKPENIISLLDKPCVESTELTSSFTPTDDSNPGVCDVSRTEGNDHADVHLEDKLLDIIDRTDQHASGDIPKVGDGLKSLFLDSSKSISTDHIVQKLCPLCTKSFKNTSAHVSHMKLCARKKNISTAELLQYIEKGSNTEFTNDTAAVLSNRDTKKSQVDEESTANAYNMALAVAMSLSTDSDSNLNVPSTSQIDSCVLNTQKATLEKFGFTSSNSAAPGKKRGKFNTHRKSVLRSRTVEDRLKLLTEKTAVVILSEGCSEVIPEHNIENTKALESHVEVPKLWELAETDINDAWYIDALKTHLVDTPTPRSSVDSTSTVDMAQEICESLNLSSSDDEDVTESLDSLQPSSSSLSNDWIRMVDNPEGSDIVIRAKDRELNAHSLVLNTRCPKFLTAEIENHLSNVPSSAVLIILQYIYSGRITRISKKNIEPAVELSKSLQTSGLTNILTTLNKSLGKENIFNDTAILVDRSSNNIINHKKETLEEADTVPNYDDSENEVTFVEMPKKQHIIPETVDLTHSDETEDDSIAAERIYWSVLKRKRYEEQREEKDRVESLQDLIEHAQELEKIESSMKQHSEGYRSLVENLEKEELEESQIEREKILNMSRFLDEKEQYHPVTVPPTDDIIELSSDDGLGAVTTDDNSTELPSNIERASTPDIPYYEPPEFNDYLEYFSSEPSYSQALPSQSLLGGTISPRTPRKVLKSKTRSPSGNSIQFSVNTAEIGGTEDGEDIFIESGPSSPIINRFTSNSSPDIFVDSSPSEELLTNSKRDDPHVHPSRSIESKILDSPKETLTTSVMLSLDETWDGRTTPTFPHKPLVEVTPVASSSTKLVNAITLPNGPFVEVTPVASSSTKLVNTVTPRPRFTSMKKSSLKKHLQRYGLKKSLAHTKARKILRHIYDELHPVVNTRNGKIVKIIPNEQGNRRKKANEGVTRSKIPAPRKTRPKTSTKVQILDPAEAELEMNSETAHCEYSDSLSPSSDSDGEENDFFDFTEDDGVLTQNTHNTMSVDSAIMKYISEHPDFHKKILSYEPIWIEQLKSALQTEYNLRYTMVAIVAFLDKKCITFRSGKQAAANMRRNNRKKVREQNRRKKAAQSNKS